MDDFLTAVSTTKVKRYQEAKLVTEDAQNLTIRSKVSPIDSPQSALGLLKDQPDFDTLSKILQFLATEADKKDGFNLVTPNPVSANIAYQLINNTVPDYWEILQERRAQLKQLVRCLRNPCGIGAIITRLHTLIMDCQQKKVAGNTRDSLSHLEELLDVLEQIFQPDACSSQIWSAIQAHAKTTIQAKMMWKEYVAQVASGKILSIAAEADDILKEKQALKSVRRLADGNEYASWLGRNIASLIVGAGPSEESLLAILDIGGKALSLGYTERIVSSMMSVMLNTNMIPTFAVVIHRMKAFEHRKYLNAVIAFIAKESLGPAMESKEDTAVQPSAKISGAVSLILSLIKDSELSREHLVSTLTNSSISVIDDSLATRRAVIAAVAQNEDQLHSLLENSLKLFGDSFFIKHAPIIQQEALAQTLVITCGYVQRSQPMFLTMMAKSSYHVSGMSNRIGSSSSRARFLGIAVGMTISTMSDKHELQLKFELEGNEASEAKWYQQLSHVNDKLGSMEALNATQSKQLPKRNTLLASSKANVRESNQPVITEFKGPRIVEILESSEDEDDDMVPYGKPDSDPEDDTDDPTEVNRNKPTAPVYVRDLIAGLRDQENYDRHALALSTAAPLVRRKANFGSEVADHIEELASILVGLNDNLDLEGFIEQRQQGLIAVLLARPAAMAQYYARAFFSGDYSVTQRTAILTTLGLGARELAGLKDSATENLIPSSPSFPSKQLPSHLHALYSNPPSNPLSKITSGLSKELLSPLASQAADQLTGPNILKVRTFSSRMEVEKRRQKPIPNALAQIVADNFFFPLTGRWWLQTRSNTDSIYTSKHLLPPFLQTLALLMNAAGPNTLSLPQMTRELWSLLLSVRGLAFNDKRVLSALLFAFLMLLETNENKEKLATEQGRELMETQEWVKMVFDGLPAGKEGEEDERVRVLAAGVVVRCGEVVEKYQRRLVGSMMDY